MKILIAALCAPLILLGAVGAAIMRILSEE